MGEHRPERPAWRAGNPAAGRRRDTTDDPEADTSQTDTTRTDAGQTGANRTSASRSGSNRTSAGQTDASRTGANQTDAGQTDANRTGAGRTGASRTGAGQGAGRQAGASRAGENVAHVTLQDVARRAGVSLATASRVLNGTTQVRPDLRERVLAAASELAYAPNAHAQALARASSQSIGLICHDVSDPYFAAISRGVARAAAERGLLVMLASTFRDPAREVDYVAMLRAQRARAILLIGSGFEDRAWERAISAELDPYVRAGGRVAVLSRHRSLRVDTVQPENRAGAAALAGRLLALGHRDFAVLSGPRTLTTVVDRLGGFRDALAEAGVPLPDDQIVEESFTRDGGFAAASELIRRGLRATCVFALTDVMAIGALSAFRHHGVDVPGQVSLAGFDDIPIVRDLVPPLTTVALPLEEMGERVMQLALRASARRSRVERIAGEVVLRDSTTVPRARRGD